MVFSEKVKHLRKEKKMSQVALADICNVTQQTVYKWEHGIVYPSIDILKKLANYFEVSTDYLLDNESKGNERQITLNEEQIRLAEEYEAMNDEGRSALWNIVKSLRLTHGRNEKSSALMNIATPQPNGMIGLVGGRV